MSKTDNRPYRADLAHIHDVGYGAFASEAAPWLLEQFRAKGVRDGLVIDLGCGSGIWASSLAKAGYDVLGYDISRSMVELARARVPASKFRCDSFLDAEFPSCAAVTALGEVFNYLFDRRHSTRRLSNLFRRVFQSLLPGGLFIFDVAMPGRVPGGSRRSWTEGDGWACLVEATEDARRAQLLRRITTFRRANDGFRRDYEEHRLQLYDRAALATQLRRVGFVPRAVRAYGQSRFPPGYGGFVARKPRR